MIIFLNFKVYKDSPLVPILSPVEYKDDPT